MIDFLTFQSRALQGVALIKIKKDYNLLTKDDIENWIKKEYNRHLKKEEPK